MLAKLYDTFFPTEFTKLPADPVHWTGDALTAKLRSLNPALPSHRRRAEELQALVDSCIANSKEGKMLGSAAAVRRAETGALTVPTAELCLDYREIRMFLAKN
jgi:hypothetical protein